MDTQGRKALYQMGFVTMNTDEQSGVATMQASASDVQATVGVTSYANPAIERLARFVAERKPVYGFVFGGEVVEANTEASTIMTSEQAARELYPYRYMAGELGNYTIDGGMIVSAIAGLVAGGSAINESISGGSSKQEDHSVSAGRDVVYVSDQSSYKDETVQAVPVTP